MSLSVRVGAVESMAVEGMAQGGTGTYVEDAESHA